MAMASALVVIVEIPRENYKIVLVQMESINLDTRERKTFLRGHYPILTSTLMGMKARWKRRTLPPENSPPLSLFTTLTKTMTISTEEIWNGSLANLPYVK